MHTLRYVLLGLCLFCPTLSADIYDDAMANPARSERDQSIDDRRKPNQILRFFQIEPEMQVLDVFAGSGYYSELMSYVVGPKGEVVLYNNEPWDKAASKALTARIQDKRLPNVQHLVLKPEALIEQPQHQFDAAIFILGMHDLYYAHPKSGWVAIDKTVFLKGIYHSLKPGAVFGVIDANAETGADNEVIGESLHRMDPAVMIADLEAAGFTLEARSDLLRNKDDDLTTSVFLPENRFKTDRSVLRFRKP